MQILVTNDDGIESTGLHVLAQALTAVGTVTVFAPSGEYSGAGAAVGHLAAGLPDVHKVERAEMPDVAGAYHLDGPPALASLLACSGLFEAKPDLVVSGINPGPNVGHAVHFSGTIGACITASVFGTPGIAVSQLTMGEVMHWQTAADAAVAQVERAMRDQSLLSVNVPNLPANEVLGAVEASLANRIPYSLHSPTMVEVSPGRFSATFERGAPFDSPPGSDTHSIDAGYVAVTELAPTRAATG